MKILSIGNFDKKIFIIIFINLLINCLSKLTYEFYYSKLSDYYMNRSLQIIIDFGLTIFFFIPEYFLRKRYIAKEKATDIKWDNKIIYIFSKQKKINFKAFLFIVLFFIIYLVYLYGSELFFILYDEKSYLVENEFTNSIIIIFFILFTRIVDKSEFYRHHYIPMIIMISMGIIRFGFTIKGKNYEFNFPDDLLYLFLGLLFTLIQALFYFIIQRYMKYKYYSPFIIISIMGTIFSVIALIIFLIFMNIDCEDSGIWGILSKKTISKNSTFVFLILDSLIYTIYLFIQIITINNYSIFHLMFLFCIGSIFYRFLNFSSQDIYQQIIIIITFVIELFNELVLLEIIILNFWGFNYNIKKNIIFRSEDEIGQLGEGDDYDEIDEEEESTINDGNLNIEFQKNNNNTNDNEDNSEY